METTHNVLTDANVYIVDEEGSSNLFGTAKSITPPIIKNGSKEIKYLGGVGTLKLATGKVELDAFKLQLNSYYPQILKKIANPFASVKFSIFANLMVYKNDNTPSNIPVKLFVTGSCEELSALAEVNEHEGAETEITITPTAIQNVTDGLEIIDIDIKNNIYKINGIDIRGEITANLGM